MRDKQLAMDIGEKLIEQGLRPALIKKYLEQTVVPQQNDFKAVAPKLSRHEREERELILLQGELLLAVVGKMLT